MVSPDTLGYGSYWHTRSDNYVRSNAPIKGILILLFCSFQPNFIFCQLFLKKMKKEYCPNFSPIPWIWPLTAALVFVQHRETVRFSSSKSIFHQCAYS